MKRVLLVLLAVLVAGMAESVTPAFAAEYSHKDAKKQETTVTKVTDLKAGLRDLWLGHLIWVRNVAVATKYGDSEAAKVAEDKAVENAKAIAGAIEPFYGKGAADKLFGLLAGHYG